MKLPSLSLWLELGLPGIQFSKSSSFPSSLVEDSEGVVNGFGVSVNIILIIPSFSLLKPQIASL